MVCVFGFDYYLFVNVVVVMLCVVQLFVLGQDVLFNYDVLLDWWWQLYGDFQFDGYVCEVLVVNIDLCVVDVNFWYVSVIVLEYCVCSVVQVDVDVLGMFIYVGGYIQVLVVLQFYVLGFYFFYLLDFVGGICRGIEVVNVDVEVVVVVCDQVCVVVVVVVICVYFQICISNYMFIVIWQVLVIQCVMLEVICCLVVGGCGMDFDVSCVSVVVNCSVVVVLYLLVECQVVLFELVVLMGRVLVNYLRDVEVCLCVLVLEQLLLVGEGWQLFQWCFDICVVEWSFVVVMVMIGVEIVEFYSWVILGVFLGIVGM